MEKIIRVIISTFFIMMLAFSLKSDNIWATTYNSEVSVEINEADVVESSDTVTVSDETGNTLASTDYTAIAMTSNNSNYYITYGIIFILVIVLMICSILVFKKNPDENKKKNIV